MTTDRRNDLWFKFITIAITVAGCFFGSYYGLVVGQSKLESRVTEISARLDRVQATTVALEANKVNHMEYQMAHDALEKRSDDIQNDLTEIKRLLYQYVAQREQARK